MPVGVVYEIERAIDKIWGKLVRIWSTKTHNEAQHSKRVAAKTFNSGSLE